MTAGGLTAKPPEKPIPYDGLDLAGERIMLVGGAGFIGHHLSLALRAKGAEVMVLDNLQVNNLVRLVSAPDMDPRLRNLHINFVLERFALMREAGVEIVNADARSLTDLTAPFSEFAPTKAVHLAAISSAVIADRNPGLAYDIQINTLRNLLELARMKTSVVGQIVFMSSSTVYGDFDGDSVDESVRPQPRGVYANGKYIGERMVREAWRLHDIPYTIVRPSALYGIRCISRRVSQVFIENALLGKPLYLEGGGDGRLDFTNIDDLVQGMVRALALESGHMMTFNLTYGNARTIADLAAILKEYVPDVTIEERPPAPEKPRRGTLLVDRAREYLDFAPTVPLDEGYRRYCAWYVEEWARLGRN